MVCARKTFNTTGRYEIMFGCIEVNINSVFTKEKAARTIVQITKKKMYV